MRRLYVFATAGPEDSPECGGSGVLDFDHVPPDEYTAGTEDDFASEALAELRELVADGSLSVEFPGASRVIEFRAAPSRTNSTHTVEIWTDDTGTQQVKASVRA